MPLDPRKARLGTGREGGGMKVERKRWEDVTILSFIGEFDAFNLPTYSQKIDALVEGALSEGAPAAAE